MANASNIKAGSAYVELLLADSKFVKGLNKAAGKLRAFGEGISSLGQRLIAVGSSVVSSLAGMGAIFGEMGESMAKLSARTGITVETLSELAYAADLSGTDISTLESCIRRMQKALSEAARGSDGANKTLGALNLTVADLTHLSPDQQFKLLADRIAQIPSPALRAALAMKLFGKSGAKLLPLMRDGAAGIEQLQKQARELGLTMSSEDATAAELLHEAMVSLWAVIKRTSFAIGAAMAPALQTAAQTVTRMIVSINAWLSANRELIASVAKTAVVVIGVGATLLAVGTSIGLIGKAMGSFASVVGVTGAAIKMVSAILSALLSPIGLVITAVVALGAYILYATDTAGEALAWLADRFNDLKDFVIEAFGGIADALASGDLALAAKVLWLTLTVAFEKGIGALEKLWLTFRSFFVKTAYDAFYGALAAWEIIQNALSVAWIETTAFLSQTWTKFTAGFTQAWDGAINWTTKRLLELQGLFDSSLDVDAAKKLADQDLAASNAQIEQEKQAQLDAREQQRQAERNQADKDHQAELARIGQQSLDKQKALDESNAARVQQAEDQLAGARKELSEAIIEARKKRQVQDLATPKRPDRPLDLPDSLSGLADTIQTAKERTIGVAGTFNPWEARGMGAGGVADRIAKATEDTAKNTKKLLEELQNLDGAEFE